MNRYRHMPTSLPEKTSGRPSRGFPRSVLVALLVAAAGTAAHGAVVSAADASPASRPDGEAAPAAHSDSTVVVKMVNYDYDPEPIRVAPGDTVRFVNTTDVPHDAAFGEVPEDARLSSEEVTPFLAQKGNSHEFVIDDRFVPGTYEIYCTPHRQLGMEGKFIVTEPEAPARDRSADGTPRAAASVPPAPPSPPAPDPPSVTTLERLPLVSVDLTAPIPGQDATNRTHQRFN